jgi:hypothetical protein
LGNGTDAVTNRVRWRSLQSFTPAFHDNPAFPRRNPNRQPWAPSVASYGWFSAITSEITMSTSLEVLEAEVLKFPPADRSHLPERLIASLDTDPDVEQAWALEADQREASLASGLVAEVCAQDAINRLRQRLVR